MTRTVLVLNGPNLNLLGRRDPAVYGTATLADVEQLCADEAARLGLTADCRQSNHEGQLIDWVQEAFARGAAGLMINPGGYTHTSVALRDALAQLRAPLVEVHLSNVHAREEFRHHSYVSPVATAVVAGMGVEGYLAALRFIAART